MLLTNNKTKFNIGLNLIKSKKLSKFKNITGFFGSKGGVSKGIYKSLNCGIGSSDKKKNIEKI